MGHIFIAVNGDNVGESIGNAIISDNHDELSRVSGAIKSAHQMLDQWVQSKGGKVIVSSGDEGIYSVPQESIGELDAIKQKYASMANTSLTIGVGSTMSEASKALIYGKMNNKDQVVHYEPAVDDYINNDGEAQAEEQAMEEQLPSEQDVVDQGNASVEGQEGLDEEQGEEGDGQEDNSDIQGEENDPNAEFAQDDEEGLDQEGELADQDQDGFGDEEQGEEQEEGSEEQSAAAPNQKLPSKNPAQAPGKPAPALKGAPGKVAPPAAIAAEGEEQEEENLEGQDDESQPAHEQGLNPEEDMEHDAQENQGDEQDGDNVEADEEEATFGEQTDDDTEAQDDSGNMDAEFNPEDQGDGEMSADASDVSDEDGVNPAADGSDEEEGMGGFGDESAEDDIQELGDHEVDQGANPDEQDGIMSEMLHANMGDEEAEDSDDEIKQDIIESLMQFKAQRAALEELKSTNPDLYQANIVILRSMIQMAKKLQMNPERALAEKGMAQDTQDAFPSAEDDQQADPNEQNPLFGKSEGIKGVHKPLKPKTGESAAGMRTKSHNKLKDSPNAAMRYMGNTDKAAAKQQHKKVLGELKDQKAPNLPKSEMCKAKVDEGKSPAQKQVARAYRNDRVKDENTKKITGTPKSSIAQPKAFSKSKTEEMKIDLKKKPDVKKQ